MNSRNNRPTNLSQEDADLLSHLTHLAESIEPDPIFKAQLEAKLLEAHQSTSNQKAHQGVNRMNFLLGRLNRRASLVACASLAIAPERFASNIIYANLTLNTLQTTYKYYSMNNTQQPNYILTK
jgi:hypothetical protein